MTRSPHDVLGLQPDATPADIERAFRRQAQRVHPDRNPSPEAASEMSDLVAARTALRATRKTGPRPKTARRHQSAPSDPGSVFDDLFEAVFGGSTSPPPPARLMLPASTLRHRTTLTVTASLPGTADMVTIVLQPGWRPGHRSRHGHRDIVIDVHDDACHWDGHALWITTPLEGSLDDARAGRLICKPEAGQALVVPPPRGPMSHPNGWRIAWPDQGAAQAGGGAATLHAILRPIL